LEFEQTACDITHIGQDAKHFTENVRHNQDGRHVPKLSVKAKNAAMLRDSKQL
jgi:hypothetical protein